MGTRYSSVTKRNIVLRNVLQWKRYLTSSKTTSTLLNLCPKEPVAHEVQLHADQTSPVDILHAHRSRKLKMKEAKEIDNLGQLA